MTSMLLHRCYLMNNKDGENSASGPKLSAITMLATTHFWTHSRKSINGEWVSHNSSANSEEYLKLRKNPLSKKQRDQIRLRLIIGSGSYLTCKFMPSKWPSSNKTVQLGRSKDFFRQAQTLWILNHCQTIKNSSLSLVLKLSENQLELLFVKENHFDLCMVWEHIIESLVFTKTFFQL